MVPVRVRRLPLATLLYFLMLSLAGCADTAPSDAGADGPPSDAVPATVMIPGAAAHCVDAVAFFTREPAAYQLHLPANYTTRDAKDLADTVGLPVSSGQAAAYVSGYTCPESDYAGGGPMDGGEVAILIQPPVLDGPGPGEDADLDFYLLNWHSNGTEHLDLLASLDLPHTAVDVTVDLAATGPAYQGAVDIDDAEGALVHYEVDALEADAYSGRVRIWSETPRGIAYADLVFTDHANAKGPVTNCSFRSGSVYAEVLGTDCDDAPGVTLLFYDQSYGGLFHYLPDVHSVAP